MTSAHAALVLVPAISAGAYAVVVEKHGVQVAQRIGASIIDLRAEGQIDAPPEKVRDLMLDYEHPPSWVSELAESRVLARGDGFVDVYQRLKLPVVADRDYTLHVTWGEDGPVRWLRFVTMNERGPAPRKGVVRVPTHEGLWQFEPEAGGARTLVRYEVKMDLAGSLPAWMVRRRAAENIPLFVEGLRHQLRL